jgi:hypothetical protein
MKRVVVDGNGTHDPAKFSNGFNHCTNQPTFNEDAPNLVIKLQLFRVVVWRL